MPKLKTHRGAAKRFSLTAKGKIKRSKAFASHILTKKTTKRKSENSKIRVLSKFNSNFGKLIFFPSLTFNPIK